MLTVLPQQQPHSHMPVANQAYANYAMGPLKVNSSLSELSLPKLFFAFYFQVPTLLIFSLMRDQPLKYALQQHFRAYPWKLYVSSSVSL